MKLKKITDWLILKTEVKRAKDFQSLQKKKEHTNLSCKINKNDIAIMKTLESF